MMVKPRHCCDRHMRSRRLGPGRNLGVWDMHVGLTMFPTDYSISPQDLAVEAEARGYESLWLPEHSHIPTSRKSPWPGGAELPKYYYDTYDPFLSLAAAAAVTKTIKLATGICLVVERDPIHTEVSVRSRPFRAGRSWGIIAFVKSFELAMGRDVTEVGAGSENNNRCHKRDLVLTVPLYPG